MNYFQSGTLAHQPGLRYKECFREKGNWNKLTLVSSEPLTCPVRNDERMVLLLISGADFMRSLGGHPSFYAAQKNAVSLFP